MTEEMVSRAEYERLRRILRKRTEQLKEKNEQLEALRNQMEMLQGTTIFELKDALHELKIEQQRYEIIAELSDDVIFEYDQESDILLTFHPSGPDGKKQRLTADFLRAALWRERGMSDETLRCIQQEAERALLDKSRTDPLTGTANRTYLECVVENYLHQIPPGTFGACMMVDVDRFKTINDTCGHLTGDALLKELAKRFQGLFRSTDIIARIGGDEFMIFIKDLMDMDVVWGKGRKMLGQATQLGENYHLPMPLTLSIGVADTRLEVDSFQELYRHADIALYNAKASGRNCMKVYETQMYYPSATAPQQDTVPGGDSKVAEPPARITSEACPW